MSDELVIKLLQWGHPAQLAVAAYLNLKGVAVTVPSLLIRPSYAENSAYSDAGDVIDEDGNSFEVQRRRKVFAGRSSFPWPYMLTVQTKKEEQLREKGVRIRGVFSVSADLRAAAYAHYESTRAHWWEQLVPHQSNPGMMKAVFMCPLELVSFVALPDPITYDHHCWCGEYGPFSNDFGRTWLCVDHRSAPHDKTHPQSATAHPDS